MIVQFVCGGLEEANVAHLVFQTPGRAFCTLRLGSERALLLGVFTGCTA